MKTEWKHPKENPPKGNSMVLVAIDLGKNVERNYAHYRYRKFYFANTEKRERIDGMYGNVILWTELPELPENLKSIEL